MFTSRLPGSRVWLLPFFLLSILLAACGGASSSSSTLNNFDNGQPGSAGQNKATHTSLLSVPMPTTRTDCPSPALSGRQPVIRSMTLGKDPAVVYINDQGIAPGENSFGELKLYNTVTGAQNPSSKVIFGKSVLVHIPGALITEAQVSANGQWLLFVTQTLNASEIQMVRVDGQGLQTLYCAPPGTVHGLQWSPDTSRFIFSQAAISGLWNLSLFDMASGLIQPELVQLNSAVLGYEARTWFDNNRVYVVGVPNPLLPSPTRGLFALDTTKGAHQTPSDLIQIIKPSQSPYCRSFDSDYDSTVLITSQCHQTFPQDSPDTSVLGGPSSIVAQGVTGGSQHTIYTSQSQAVTQVRMLSHSSDTLLLTIANLNPNTVGLANAESPLNGLWKMNMNGSGLTNLAQSDSFSECELNQFTQYPWSNISLDNHLYALEVHQVLGKSAALSLQVGSLSGDTSASTTFENGSANLGFLAIAGWTSV